MDNPTVSVVTPSFNQGQFIEVTLRSVMEQSYDNIEHIVMDGGSTDETLEILKKYEDEYRLRWRSREDKGQSWAINEGIRRSNGSIVTWINSDDAYVTHDAVEAVVERFRCSNCEVVYGDDVMINSDGEVIRVRKFLPFNVSRLLYSSTISQPATFIRGTAWRDLDEDLEFAMDLELWLRLASRGTKFCHLDKILAGDRIHSERKTVASRGETQRLSRRIRNQYGGGESAWWRCRYFVEEVFRRANGLAEMDEVCRRISDFPVAIDCHGSRLRRIVRQIFAQLFK